MRTSGKTNSPPGSPNLHRAGSGGEGKKKIEPLSLPLLGRPALTPRGCIFLCLPNQTECNQAVALVCHLNWPAASNFCCG